FVRVGGLKADRLLEDRTRGTIEGVVFLWLLFNFLCYLCVSLIVLMAIEDDLKKKGAASGSNTDLNLHVNDPLYLHANDSNGTPLITFKLTGTDNYKV
ncbi:hypothetical protein Tco_1388544, partial [Tanacetum coccineum]